MPVAPAASRSCTKPRNGATPVPGPTMMMSREPSAGTRKRSFFSIHTCTFAIDRRVDHEVRGGAGQQLAIRIAADHGHREMRFIAHGRGARGDGIHAAGHRTQHVHQRFGRPFRRVAAEDVGHLAGGREFGHRLRVAEQLGDIRRSRVWPPAPAADARCA